MAQIKIETPNIRLQIEVDKQADFVSCALTALMEAVPCFTAAFLKCLSGGSIPDPSPGYKPGTRKRC